MKFNTGPKASFDPLLKVMLNRAMRMHASPMPKPPKISFKGQGVTGTKGVTFSTSPYKPASIPPGDINYGPAGEE